MWGFCSFTNTELNNTISEVFRYCTIVNNTASMNRNVGKFARLVPLLKPVQNTQVETSTKI